MPRFIEGDLVRPEGRVALCVSRFNPLVTDKLLQGALDALSRHGVRGDDVDVFRVPGAFELPGLACRLARQGEHAGVVVLGAVIRGGTPHFDYVAAEVSRGVGNLALEVSCPVTFGVLTCDSVEQALERAGGSHGNKGADAALACLEMINLYARVASAHRN
jgi:6,7-dimethyl-8-ribityllumazine synthase